MSRSIDISETHKEIVQAILREHLTTTCHVWVFGSRATWLAKEYSDLDLAIARKDGTPLSLTVMSALETAFEDSLLPWKVDVVDLHSVSEEFRTAIERDKVLFSLDIESKWTKTKLKNIFKVKHGYAFKSIHFSEKPSRFVLVTPGNFSTSGGFQNNKPKYYCGPIPNDYVLKPGQIVITMTDLSKNSDTLGLASTIPNDGNIWLHNQRVGLLEFKNSFSADSKFISYFLRKHEYRSWIVGSATGTTVKHTAPVRIQEYEDMFPPLPEQKAIAHILGTLDDKIELNRQTNQTLEAMAQALFQSWFVDFDPVIDKALAAGNEIPEAFQAKAAARQALGDQRLALPEEVTALFPDAFVFTEEMGWIPEGWAQSSVGNEFSVTMGQSPPGDTYNETGEGIVFFQGKRDFGFRFPSNRIYCTDPKRFANKNDTLISVRAPVGDINMASSECCIGRGLSATRHKSGSRTFTYYAMLQLREHFKVFESEGTVFGSINQNDFKKLPQLKFKVTIVKAFDSFASELDDKIELNSEHINKLTTLRDTLLPKLISGELRVTDAGGFLGEISV